MLRTMGADAVGMSTVLEAVAARWVGLEVCGVSLVTNAGAGYTDAAADPRRRCMAAGERPARGWPRCSGASSADLPTPGTSGLGA